MVCFIEDTNFEFSIFYFDIQICKSLWKCMTSTILCHHQQGGCWLSCWLRWADDKIEQLKGKEKYTGKTNVCIDWAGGYIIEVVVRAGVNLFSDWAGGFIREVEL